MTRGLLKTSWLMNYPLVAIVLPIRNEARYIARCLEAVTAQDYPADKINVLAVDGLSSDETRSMLSDFASRDARIRLLDNPKQITSTALNLGVSLSQSEVVIIVGGHTKIAHNYVRLCIEAFKQSNADCVGGVIETVGETDMARAIALAQSSPFGVGGARFRYSTRAEYVDTVAFGAYRRQVFERIGLFDEELVRNQDDEFNFRLTRAGGKIWLDPQIKSIYYSRGTLRRLWKQYYEYGFWKVRVIQKHGRPAALRHLVPVLFVGALGATLLLSLVTQNPLWVLLIFIPYALAALAASVWSGLRSDWRIVPFLPIVFFVLHTSYGAGFLVGLIHWNLRVRTRAAMIKPS